MSARLSAKLLTACILLMVNSFVSSAQNAPVTTAATIGGAIPGNVDVPVSVTGFNNIGAISLSIDYDYSVMHFTGATPNPQLSNFPAGDLDLGTGYHRVSMGWFGAGKTLPDSSTIITLHFNFIGGITDLTWYDNGPSCEYADGSYNVLNDIPTVDYYHNGHICGVIGAPGAVDGSDTVCQGEPEVIYSLAAVPNATGYNWTVPPGAWIVNGQNTNSITVNYSDTASSGNITVFTLNYCGSGPASSLPVTVNPLPVADAGDDISIPHGTSTTLQAAPGGSGYYSYHWSPEEMLVDPNVMNPQTVILTSTTIFTLTVTDTETQCQAADQVTVTITGGPLSVSPVTLPPVICAGGSAQLFSNAGGGSGNYTYQWISDPPGSPPWSSTLPNPVVSPDSSRQYMLTVSDGFTITSGSTNLGVNPLPTATLSGGDTLCGQGATTTLQVDLTGVPPWSYTYSYGSTSVFVTGEQSSPSYIIASDPGDYIITYVEDAHCNGTSSGMAIVRRYPVPATPEITVNGYELISSSCCGNQWYKNEALIPGATGQTYIVSESGLYTVIVTLNTCSSVPSEPVDIIVGIKEQYPEAFTIYPNPAESLVTIQPLLTMPSSIKTELYSRNGTRVKSQEHQNNGEALQLDINDLPPGLYLVRLVIDGSSTTQKIIVR